MTVWRDEIGNETLRIGELAEMANVTKRTVDYYTNMGLLAAYRSPSNYRYYPSCELEKLKRILEYKKKDLSLEDIKVLMKYDQSKDQEESGYRLKSKMDGLNEGLKDVIQIIEKDEKNEVLKKQVSPESIALLQSLLVLLI